MLLTGANLSGASPVPLRPERVRRSSDTRSKQIGYHKTAELVKNFAGKRCGRGAGGRLSSLSCAFVTLRRVQPPGAPEHSPGKRSCEEIAPPPGIVGATLVVAPGRPQGPPLWGSKNPLAIDMCSRRPFGVRCNEPVGSQRDALVPLPKGSNIPPFNPFRVG
jgi:hypothetical protein